MRAVLHRLREDARGATIIEFAVVAPVMCLLLLSGFDISHTLYTRAALQGVVQKTARDSTMESDASLAAQGAMDQKVTSQVLALANNAEVKITRRFYRSFAEAVAAKAEAFTDTNGNGRCDAGEPYEDDNLNSVWDADGGNAGQGGAKDAVVYTVQMTYPRMFPIYNFYNAGRTVKLVASTVLRNQPYDNQQSYGEPVVRNCP